jgi:hypothetical protein
MTHVQIEPEPVAAEIQASAFGRLAAVIHVTGLGRTHHQLPMLVPKSVAGL